jgi:hypothetical protein
MDQVRIGIEFPRNPDGLRRTAWMTVYDYDIRFSHGEFLTGEAAGSIDNMCNM